MGLYRLGIDFGGTKIELAALEASGGVVLRERMPNPGDYRAAVEAVRRLVRQAEAVLNIGDGDPLPVGVGLPGSLSPATGLMRNANSVWLNGMPFQADLQAALLRPVRLANDANCFALSEAVDGAATGATVVFGVILGTGCGGVVVNGRLVEGANGIGGEWGHTPLPWMTAEEHPGPLCWCGRRGCLETFTSGSGLERDHAEASGRALKGEAIIAGARAGEPRAVAALGRYIDRLGRALAAVCNLLDPNVIVLGGGLSNVGELYAELPAVLARHIFSDVCRTRIVPALHGDSSGVRGAAWL